MGTSDDGYERLEYMVSPASGAPEFLLEAQWRDITKLGDDATTWRVLEGGKSFRVSVTGRTVNTVDHPIPPTEGLKLAMLLAVRDAILSRVELGADHPVTVTRDHLDEGERQARRLEVLSRKSHVEKRYTGAPGKSASFDNLTDLLEHTSLPDFAGSLEGDSERVVLAISDRQTGETWEYAGHPDELHARFNEWLKKTYNIDPRTP